MKKPETRRRPSHGKKQTRQVPAKTVSHLGCFTPPVRVRAAIPLCLAGEAAGCLAAVDDKAVAGDKGGVVGGEEGEERSHVRRTAHPAQGDLFYGFSENDHYFVLASNREETAEETVAWYNQRGETSENRIKELKSGFGLERMPCGQFGANAMFFSIGVLAYNLFIMFKQDVLPKDWRRHQVRTLRWRLYQSAGKVVSHSGYLWLRVKRWMFALLEEIRTRSFELASA